MLVLTSRAEPRGTPGRRLGQLEDHRTPIRLDGDLEPQEPATVPLCLDRLRDRRERRSRRLESEPQAVGQHLAVRGEPQQSGEQRVAPDREHVRRQGAGNRQIGHVDTASVPKR
jgi:hypothetical protein